MINFGVFGHKISISPIPTMITWACIPVFMQLRLHTLYTIHPKGPQQAEILDAISENFEILI